MIKKIELGSAHKEVFAEATPLGLIGLAVGCAALTPIAFGKALDLPGLQTAAMYCLMFGGGCQFLAGLFNFANKNLFGGTLLTAFSFNWAMNYWALDAIAKGHAPSPAIILAVDICFLIVFVVMTYGFGFFSKLLFLFLLDIDLMYVCRILKELTHSQAFNIPIAALTVMLGVIALYIALGMIINPTAGRAVFKFPGPMFLATPKPAFDFSFRKAIFELLFNHWREHAFEPMTMEQLRAGLDPKFQARKLEPELHYFAELGAVAIQAEGTPIRTVRLTAQGIDFYEQTILGKYAA